MPYRYAAVRMDPVAMVEHLQDPIALSKARAIQPKTYLVFMEGVRVLRFSSDATALWTVLTNSAGARAAFPRETLV